MTRPRGGYIAFNRAPAASAVNSAAVGIWTLREAESLKRAGTWPIGNVDSSFANVSLLLHMNGTSGSTTFTDSSTSTKTITASATEISTAQSKFGGASGLFSGGYLSVQSNADFGFGVGDFTVEFWLYYTGGNGYVFFWGNNQGFDQYISYGLNSSTKQPFLWNEGNVLTTSTAITNNTWQHHAVVRSAGTIAMYLDGVQLNSGSFGANIGSSRPFRIGDNGLGDQTTSGYIDEFRVTKGVARYTAAFDPPSAPFPDA